MPRNRDDSRAEVAAKVTVLQVRAQLLCRQPSARDDLPKAAYEWLEESLAALMQTAQDLAALVMDDAPPHTGVVDDEPTARLQASDSGSRN